MSHQLLERRLAPLARQRHRWLLWRALAKCWAAGGIVSAGLLLAAVLGAGLPSSAAALVLALALVVAACCGVWWRRQRVELVAVARELEAEHHQLDGLLLTAVEQEPETPGGPLGYLQERVVREALEYQRRHVLGERLSQQLVAAQAAHGLALVFFVAALAGLHVMSGKGRNEFAPVLLGGPQVIPGDTELERGSSLTVMARFPRHMAGDATLVLVAPNQPERRTNLVRNLKDPVYGATIPDLEHDLRYRVEYAGKTTREYQVKVFDLPRLERADATLSFPAYTGLPAKTIPDTRRISAVEGSDLDYQLTLNKPGVTGRIYAGGNLVAELPLDPAGSQGRRWHLTLQQSGRYDLVLRDDAGRTNRLPHSFAIEVLTNRAPQLKLAFPRGDQRVSPLEEVAFQAEVTDDFGAQAYGITYTLAGQEPRVLELGRSVPARERRQFAHLLPLEDLHARPDQLLSYYVWADDHGPDGKTRRTASDMFFAEVRPFEEIFREGQSGGAGEQEGAGQQEGTPSTRLADLQKQIINATWKVQRREPKDLSPPGREDVKVIVDSQTKALEQARKLAEESDTPQAKALWGEVEKPMDAALGQLQAAVTAQNGATLPAALGAEQSAYQALLKLAAREHQVARGNSRSRSSGRGGERAQRQLDQLELKQAENRYETERQAASEQNRAQGEDLAVLNRLRELAERQQDLNDRLKELQTALEEAKSEAQRDQIQRLLKRLREEEQQMLADLDEVRQRLDRPDNQERAADAQRRLEQTRAEAQRAAQSMDAGEVSQALASGTRAQRGLEDVRDEFRKQSSNRFAEDLRQMREDARQLAQKEAEIGQQLGNLGRPQRPALRDEEDHSQVAQQLDSQKQALDKLLNQATEVTRQAEASEPLLAKQLEDTVRQASQDEAKNLQQTTEELFAEGRLRRPVFDSLRKGKEAGKRALEVTAELLREGNPREAEKLEEHARQSLVDLQKGVEKAAASVLGDDLQALRLAQRALDQLERQVADEVAQAEGRAGSRDPQTSAANRDTQPRPGQGQETARADRQQADQARPPGQRQPASQQQGRQGGASAGRSDQNAQAAGDPRGNEPRVSQDTRDAQSSPRRTGSDTATGGQRRFFEDSGGNPEGLGGWRGPILGPDYAQWTDRMREVEEMLDATDLRTQAARIRDRVRAVRSEFKRHGKEPQWDLVKMEIAGPLAELRSRVADELARRGTPESLVPIDREPVPPRYSELVRRYYERLGKSD